MNPLLLLPILAVATATKPVPLADAPEPLRRLLVDLRDATARRDAEAVYRHLAPDYVIERDFGGGYEPQAPAREKFSQNFQFDDRKLRPEYQGHGWAEFGKYLDPRTFDRTSPGERWCAPAGAQRIKPMPEGQLCFKAGPDGTWQISGFINGGD